MESMEEHAIGSLYPDRLETFIFRRVKVEQATEILSGAAAAQFPSPTVLPSPQGYGAGPWSSAYQRASAVVAKLTLEELNNLTYGQTPTDNSCAGYLPPLARIGFPGLCLADAGNGVRAEEGVNSYAAGISVGASWNTTLAYQRGFYMGREFRAKGAHVAFGPVVGPLGRTAEGGRNWEGFAADPYLAGSLAAQTVQGLQKSTIACVKHFFGNEQETNRNPSGSPINDPSTGGTAPSTSSNIDDRAAHELYIWPFQDALNAGAASVMCSYNRINGSYSCANSKSMNGLLKGELNFQGFVVSDFGAQHSGVNSANAGLDLAMPHSVFWDKNQLADAVQAGTLNRTRLVDMVTRIVAAWYFVGEDKGFPKPGVGMATNLLIPHTYVNAKEAAAGPELLQEAIEGHVLVKNSANALPLRTPDVLSIFGYDAIEQVIDQPDPQKILGVVEFDPWTLNEEFINLTTADYAALAVNDPPPADQVPQRFQGTLVTGGGSGSNTPAYISSPYNAIASRARRDGTTLFHDFVNVDPSVVTTSSACLVFINEWASESYDRPGLADSRSDSLVQNVAKKCSNTIVTIHNAGIRTVDAWISHPNITGVIFAHLPGQEAGNAIVDILFGTQSPSGRLPYTVAKQPSDYGDLLSPCQALVPLDPQCTYAESTAIDYRSFLKRGITPLFEFGFGLTYANFSYSGLSISASRAAILDSQNHTGSGKAFKGTQSTEKTTKDPRPGYGMAGLNSLFYNIANISATITNTGKVAAAEVAQLYLSIPGADTKQLRGFSKLFLQPGQSAKAVFPLRLKDISIWNVTAQQWVVPSGQFGIEVGASVLDTRLRSSYVV